MKKFIWSLLTLFTFYGCGVKQSEYDKLTLQRDSIQIVLFEQDSIIKRLQDSIVVLSYPAEQRYDNILKLVKEFKLDSALFEIHALKEIFPRSTEAMASNKQIEYIEQQKAIIKAEEERKKALGYKVFQDSNPILINEKIKCSFSGFNYGRTFTFDYCLDVDEYHYRTVDKGNVYILADMTMSTKEKYASTPTICVYKIENGNLSVLTHFKDEYATWTSYGAMIGNYSDDSHSFSKVNAVRYKLAAEISIEDSKQPLIIIADKKGSYPGNNLSITDVQGKCHVIKILNRNKL